MLNQKEKTMKYLSHITQGGGGVSNSSLNNTKSVYKPLIASSLALALGVSVASATATCRTSGTPAICLDSNTTDQSSSFNITWTDDSGYKAIQSSSQIINNLVFQFGDSISHSVSTSNQKNILTATTNSNSLSLNGNSTSIKLDLLKVDFGNNTNKSFILDLNNIATTSNFAFSGGIAVNGSSETNTFSATLGGKGLQWSIDIDSKGTHKFVFTENASASRIWSKKGTNTYTFEKDATISSGSEVIYAGWYADGSNQAKNSFIFKGNTTIKSTKNNQSNGNKDGVVIWANGNKGSTRDNTYNHMTFLGATNAIIGTITAVSNANSDKTRFAENKLTFTESSTTNAITGNISANFGYNTFSFAGSTNTITGNLNATSFGTNTIVFERASGINKIDGKISATGTNYTVETTGGQNTITLSGKTSNTIIGNIEATGGSVGQGLNTITFDGTGTNTITGDVSASYGNNSITFSSSASNTLGNTSIIAGDGGTNNITATNLTFQNPRSITAGAGGYTSINRFDISGNMTFNNSSTLVIKASNTANTNTDKHNIFKFGGNISKSYIAELSAVSASGDLTKTKNILSFDGLSTATTLSIGYINKTTTINSHSTGYNYIGKGLTTGSGSSLALSFEENNWNQSRYQAENLALNVTGDIYAKYGKNFINVGSVEVGGKIDGNGGHNYIATSGSFTSGAIKARWGGSNNIIIGGNATIASISAAPDSSSNDNSRSINNITFSGNNSVNAVLGDIIIGSASTTAQNNFTLSGNGTTLALGGATNTVSSLTASGNVLVNLAMTDNNGRPRSARSAKTLEIGANSGSGFKGSATFEVYTAGNTADSITFKSAQAQDSNSTKSVATIVASGDINTILNGDGKTLKVATVENGAKDKMEVIGGKRLIGGVVVGTTLASTDSGNNTNYYLGKGVDEGAPIQYQEVASSALTVNYDLYLANFNSLNKRMGELRDNPHSNGVWARVFGGSMSNDFGAGSKTNYITAQGGYDYSFSVGENAKNYAGVAVAYGKSWTKGNTLSMNGLIGASSSISLSSVDSSMVEVGIYNSYVADSGWYNDSILKFDYIMSEFSLSNDPTMSKTNNFAMVLSNEVGYRYKFAENEKGNWYIDPQVEIAFGYFNQSDFNRAMYDASGSYQSTMQATQDTILTLRSRAGLSLGKKFVTEKGFASIYVGASYEYDYINGGEANVAGRVGGTTTSLDSLESNGRAIVNVGSNIGLSESARLYIDVEKSFGDKQRTFMQFNFGARYSF